jgi:hypothetical protein
MADAETGGWEPSGEYRDVLLGADGRVVWETAWERNLIVNSFRRLLAALVKGDAQGVPIAFWAVGTGNPSWDAGTVPTDAARRARAGLFTETGRKAVPPGQITFVGGTFTNRLEITQSFTTADIPSGAGNPADLQLREFGLFAGGPRWPARASC